MGWNFLQRRLLYWWLRLGFVKNQTIHPKKDLSLEIGVEDFDLRIYFGLGQMFWEVLAQVRYVTTLVVDVFTVCLSGLE